MQINFGEDKQEIISNKSESDFQHDEYIPEDTVDTNDLEDSEDVNVESSEVEDNIDSENESVKETPRVKHRIPASTRINQIQREKYRALDEAQRLREENEHLRRLSEDSSIAAMHHYDEGINLKLDNLRKLKAQAIEAGDVQAQVDAEEKLSKLNIELVNSQNWKAQQALISENNRRNQEQKNYYQQQQHPNEEEATRWVSENTWFNPKSHDYDPQLAQATQSEADKLDAHLYRTGNQDKIYSVEYFNALNSRINELIQYQQDNQVRRTLNMKQPRHQLAPARGNVVGGRPQKQERKLNAEEKDMAKRLGLKEDVLLKSIIKDPDIQKQRGRVQ